MKRMIWLLWMQGGLLLAQSPDTLDLFECHRLAREAHPLRGQKALYEQIESLAVKNHRSRWLPGLDLNGSYTWQNEVVELPIRDMPGFDVPSPPHYNLKMTLDIRQSIYDGGMSGSSRQLEEATLAVNRQQVEVSLNQSKDQVNHLYFRILVLQKQQQVRQLKMNELEKRMEVMRSAIRNETRLASDLRVLQAEKLRLSQQLAELEIGARAARRMLGTLISKRIGPETALILPSSPVDHTGANARPELMLYDLQIDQLEARIGLTQRKRFPTAFAFGTFGYGNPALDFFRDEFRGYYIVGAGLNWTLWDWSETARNKQQLAVQQDLVETGKKAFRQKVSIQSETHLAEMAKYEEAVKRDEEILRLREAITRTAVSQLENELITPTEYLSELNAETEARITLEMHRIQLEMSRIAYLTTLGNI